MMSVAYDYYAVLGVPPDASSEDIHAAFQLQVQRFNPDSNPNPGVTSQFKDVLEALDVLADRQKRAEYDRLVNRHGLPPPYLSLRVTPSKPKLKVLEEPQVLYVLLEISPDPSFTRQQTQEAPLNLALVIDRSTSMRGARLDKTKQAVHRIVDTLTPQDRLAIVAFSDRAELILESTPVLEKPALRARASTMQASGGTEIYRGMLLGVEQIRKNFDRQFVNHVILLTDGQTYGDEEQCLALASEMAEEGIGLSAIGIGEEWNDVFLDELASRTGGSSEYIHSPSAVERFLSKHIRSLGAAFIERLQLSIAPDIDVKLEDAFKLSPNAQPLPTDATTIPLGNLERARNIAIILQFQLPVLPQEGFRNVFRLCVSGDVLREDFSAYKAFSDFGTEVAEQHGQQNPPTAILEALGKLTLYRLQTRAQQALARGDLREATRRLENLATRLLENGEESLAHAALAEARRVARTTTLSDEGQKNLKYGTRALLTGVIPAGDTGPIATQEEEP
jgi:Ca-activated chloride channel family protein